MLQDPGDVFEDDPTILDSDVLYRMVRYDTVLWGGESAVRVVGTARRGELDVALEWTETSQ